MRGPARPTCSWASSRRSSGDAKGATPEGVTPLLSLDPAGRRNERSASLRSGGRVSADSPVHPHSNCEPKMVKLPPYHNRPGPEAMAAPTTRWKTIGTSGAPVELGRGDVVGDME